MLIKIAHRGFSGIAPENTMVAFQKALEVGVDGVELDVHGTLDRQVVSIHDSTLDRTTDREQKKRRGKIKKQTTKKKAKKNKRKRQKTKK